MKAHACGRNSVKQGFFPEHAPGRVYGAQPLCATAGARPSTTGKTSGQASWPGIRASLRGMKAGRGSWASLRGMKAGRGSWAGLKGQGKLRARHQGESAGREGRARFLGRTQGQGFIQGDGRDVRASALTCGATAGLSEADKSRASVRYIDSLPRGCQCAVLVHA